MKLFILKTDVSTKQQLDKLAPAFEKFESITRWTIDLDDIDKVLKVETSVHSEQNELIKLVRDQGIHCEELTD